MLAVAESRQQGFFDAAWCGNVVPRDSFYGLLAEHGERIVRDEDFADCYSERRGRPSIPPSILAKLLLLEYRSGLSDRQAMEAVRFDLRWKVALGLPLDHGGFHPTSLVKFRARLLLHGKERVVFERSLALAAELGLLEEAAEQVVDSTPMLGAAATQDTVTLVRSGVRKLLDAVSGEDAEAAASLARNLEFDYAKPRQKPDCDWRSKPARERLLTRVAQDAERALRAVASEPELAACEPVVEATRLLRELIGQDFELDEHDVPRLRRGTAKDRILSVHDPEMRHGRKSQSQRFDGYKIHAVAATEAPLLTAIEVSPGCGYDGEQAPALIDSQREELRPRRLLGGRAAGDGRPDRQARLPDRSRRRYRDLPRRRDRAHRAAAALGDARRRLRGSRLPRLPAQAALRAGSPRTQDRPPPPRGPAASRPRSAQRSADTRAPSQDAPAHRALTRPARPPLPRPQEPLPRQTQSLLPGRLDRRTRQHAPDRGRARRIRDVTK